MLFRCFNTYITKLTISSRKSIRAVPADIKPEVISHGNSADYICYKLHFQGKINLQTQWRNSDVETCKACYLVYLFSICVWSLVLKNKIHSCRILVLTLRIEKCQILYFFFWKKLIFFMLQVYSCVKVKLMLSSRNLSIGLPDKKHVDYLQ